MGQNVGKTSNNKLNQARAPQTKEAQKPDKSSILPENPTKSAQKAPIQDSTGTLEATQAQKQDIATDAAKPINQLVSSDDIQISNSSKVDAAEFISGRLTRKASRKLKDSSQDAETTLAKVLEEAAQTGDLDTAYSKYFKANGRLEGMVKETFDEYKAELKANQQEIIQAQVTAEKKVENISDQAISQQQEELDQAINKISDAVDNADFQEASKLIKDFEGKIENLPAEAKQELEAKVKSLLTSADSITALRINT